VKIFQFCELQNERTLDRSCKDCENEALHTAQQSKMDDEDALCAPVEVKHSVPSTASRLPPTTTAVIATSVDNGAVANIACPPPLELGWTRLGKRPVSSTFGDSSASPSKTARQEQAEGDSGAPARNGGGSPGQDPHKASDNKGRGDADDSDDDDFWMWNESPSSCWSCADPNCLRRREEMKPSTGVGFVFQRRRAGATTTGQPHAEKFRAVRGQAVWLLPTASTSDVDWFQGYLIIPPPTARDESTVPHKPWGLLAHQVDIDECLACADGGYRRVSINMYDWSGDGPTGPAQQQGRGNKRTRPQRLGEADWTGGDMMKLLGSNVRMRPTQLLTGRAAVPYVTGLFSSLWKRIAADHEQSSCEGYEGATGTDKDHNTNDNNNPAVHEVLDLLPEVAIVLGDMEVILPVDPDDGVVRESSK
jgi:hypothetical protein